jgi:hypothetical protein
MYYYVISSSQWTRRQSSKRASGESFSALFGMVMLVALLDIVNHLPMILAYSVPPNSELCTDGMLLWRLQCGYAPLCQVGATHGQPDAVVRTRGLGDGRRRVLIATDITPTTTAAVDSTSPITNTNTLIVSIGPTDNIPICTGIAIACVASIPIPFYNVGTKWRSQVEHIYITNQIPHIHIFTCMHMFLFGF